MRRDLSAILAVIVLGAAPTRAWADDDEKKPAEVASAAPSSDDAYPPFSTRFKVLTAGLLVSGAAWGVSFAAARAWPEATCHITVLGAFDAHGQPCSSGPPGSAQLGIPIAGPWIALGKSGCPSDEPNCSGAKIGARAFAYILDGIVQAAGVALIVQAVVMKTEAPGGPTKVSALSFQFHGVELRPIPVVTPSMTGLALGGTF